MQDLDIFVFTQGIPKVYPRAQEYKLVSIEEISEPCEIEKICLKDVDDPILKNMEHAYSEGARIHALWKNYPLKKYVGTAHYRRYLDFMDEIPDMDEIFSDHDAIYQPFDLGWPSIRSNYAGCHNIDDLNLCVDIIKERYPQYAQSADWVMGHDFLVPCNIFVLTKEMFCEWCEFVFGILDEFNNKMGFKTDLDVCNHVVNNMDKYVTNKGGLPNTSTAYQSRIHAFLMERLSSIFFKERIHKPYYSNMLLTEVHFDFEKNYFHQYEKQDNSDNNR